MVGGTGRPEIDEGAIICERIDCGANRCAIDGGGNAVGTGVGGDAVVVPGMACGGRCMNHACCCGIEDVTPIGAVGGAGAGGAIAGGVTIVSVSTACWAGGTAVAPDTVGGAAAAAAGGATTVAVGLAIGVVAGVAAGFMTVGVVADAAGNEKLRDGGDAIVGADDTGGVICGCPGTGMPL